MQRKDSSSNVATTNDALRELIEEIGPELEAGAAECDRENRFVAASYEVLKANGVFSALVPEELGGGGIGHGEMCARLRQLARHCGSTALSLSMHQHLVATSVWKYRRGQPGRAVLDQVARSQLVLVSTGARDWLRSNGQTVAVDGGYRVSAQKAFASGSPAGDLLITSAPFEDPEQGWQVLHFSVPLDAPGVRIEPTWDAHGMRGTGSETVVLDEAFVPEAAVVLRRPRDAYHPAWNVVLTAALPLIVSAYVGVAEKAAQIATERAKRTATDPLTAVLIGEMENELTTAQVIWRDMVALARDLDFEPTIENADAELKRKTLATQAAVRTVEKAMEVAGGPGFFRSMGLERLLRDVRGAHYHPLPEKRQLMFSGRVALGLEPIDDVAPV